MFFDSPEKIPELIKNSGFSIFVLNQPIALKSEKSPKKVIKTAAKSSQAQKSENTIFLDLQKTATTIVEPEKNAIRVDQIRELTEKTKNRQTSDQFILVKNAELMNEQAENAFLKLLEEPKDHYHFALFTKSAGSLLPTVLSRAKLYILRSENPLDAPVSVDETLKTAAKKLLAAGPRELIAIAEDLTNKKKHKNPRADALEIVDTAIELSFKSYFVTKNPNFLKKLEKLLALQRNLQGNGHIKLHLVADLC